MNLHSLKLEGLPAKKGRVAVDNQMKEFYCNHENPSQTMHGR